jgi:EAL domain-containing protein (putative c-di-GMP-specific phosphodiesterase class I)
MARANLSDPDPHGVARRKRGLLLGASSLTAETLDVVGEAAGQTFGKARVPFRFNRPNRFLVSSMHPVGGGYTPSNWHFLCVAELVNFAQLRRHVGAARADRLIFDVAERIAALLPTARLSAIGRSAIEFNFEGDGLDEADAALAALREAFAEPLDIDGESYRFDLLLAGAGAPVAHLDDVRLAEEAEEAAALARTEQRIVLRDLSSGAPAFDRLTLMRDLASALENGEMFLQYQPKVHVRRQQITSAEALIRWQHPTRGLILPGDFIQIAEESRDIGALTLWTLDQVIADQARLIEQGHDLSIFVNISGQLLGDPQFVAEACDKVRAAKARIGFEITETSVIRDPETAIAHLQQFADIGIPIAIDDYGAGLSSLAYLKQLPASELKIDKMFVMQLTSSNRDPLIVRSTIDLAHALEMEVTAEGVETQAALALLSVMGCDMVQGFLISRPVSFDAFVKFLADERRIVAAEAPRGSFNQPASFWKSA